MMDFRWSVCEREREHSLFVKKKVQYPFKHYPTTLSRLLIVFYCLLPLAKPKVTWCIPIPASYMNLGRIKDVDA